jgi:hypothetical protein
VTETTHLTVQQAIDRYGVEWSASWEGDLIYESIAKSRGKTLQTEDEARTDARAALVQRRARAQAESARLRKAASSWKGRLRLLLDRPLREKVVSRQLKLQEEIAATHLPVRAQSLDRNALTRCLASAPTDGQQVFAVCTFHDDPIVLRRGNLEVDYVSTSDDGHMRLSGRGPHGVSWEYNTANPDPLHVPTYGTSIFFDEAAAKGFALALSRQRSAIFAAPDSPSCESCGQVMQLVMRAPLADKLQITFQCKTEKCTGPSCEVMAAPFVP